MNAVSTVASCKTCCFFVLVSSLSQPDFFFSWCYRISKDNIILQAGSVFFFKKNQMKYIFFFFLLHDPQNLDRLLALSLLSLSVLLTVGITASTPC